MPHKVHIADPGLFTTIQDKGRPYLRKYGIPVSGAMDWAAYQFANHLVGNKNTSPVLECTLKGGSFKFDSRAVIAITGADMQAKINHVLCPTNESLLIQPGDTLEMGYARRGCRAYLAIQGDWELEKVFDSYSTYTLAGFGGLHGRALQKGDCIQWNGTARYQHREIPKELIPYYSNRVKLRVLKGPEWDWLSQADKEMFLSSEFIVQNQSDRMGIRLEGESVLSTESGQIISSATVPGTIQLTTSGQPIILMKDGQTTGGYPRIATVIESELSRLSQIPPGSKIQFKLVDYKEATQLLAYYKDLLNDFEQS